MHRDQSKDQLVLSRFRSPRWRRLLPIAAALVVACGSPAPPDAERAAEPAAQPAAETESAPRALGLPDAFVDRVWRVASSSSVAPGTLYTFRGDGTLTITSPNSTPAVGAWRYVDGKLTMIEESIPYPTDILSLTADTFTIRSNNPGTPVEIRLELASQRP